MYHELPEDKARHDLINPALTKAGWKIQHFKTANIYASKGIAVEFFQLGKGVGEADYVLFVDGKACGIIEAKKEGMTLIGKEPQSNRYAQGFPKEFVFIDLPLPFVYESTGTETRFTNLWDPKPRSREIFSFHKPETLEKWIADGKETLRKKLTEFPKLENDKLWPAQRTAILNLEKSLNGAKPRALIQMATGSGKTFTAVNMCYRSIKNAKAKRILFLVDRGNLGEQAETEFETFVVPQDGRKFTELYNVHKLTSNKILDSDKVCISTIQRVYSMLKGEKKFEEINEEKSIMVTCIGATIGKTGFSKVKSATNQQINSIAPNKEKYSPELIYYLMISEKMQRLIKENSSSTTMPILNKSKFMKLELKFPKKKVEQEKIVQEIESRFSVIDKLEQSVDSSLNKTDQLRKSILKSAFEGKLVKEPLGICA